MSEEDFHGTGNQKDIKESIRHRLDSTTPFQGESMIYI